MIKIAFLLLITFAASMLAFAEQPPVMTRVSLDTSRPLTVAGLSIGGLKRTRREVIEHLLKPFLGLSLSPVDLEEVKNTLRETGLFDRIEASLKPRGDGSAILSLEVEEKLTLIPIPFISVSDEGLKGGLMLMDMNAFGLNDRAGIGGMLSRTGGLGLVGYLHNPEEPGSFGWSLFSVGSRDRVSIVDERERRREHYDIVSADTAANLLFKPASRVTIKTGLTFRERAILDGDIDSSRSVGAALGCTVKTTRWDGTFLSERAFTASGAWYCALVGKSFPRLEAHGVWEQPLADGLRFVSGAGASWFAPGAGIAVMDKPTDINIAILPADMRSRALAGGRAGLEYRILSIKTASLALLASAEAVALDGCISKDIAAWGPAFNARVYLSKIAFPALDLGVSCNAQTGRWQFAGGLGVSF